MEPFYADVHAFLEDLQQHPVELEHNNEIKTVIGVWKSFGDFKQGIETTYNIEFYNTIVEYEDDDGILRKINNEKEYLEAVKTVDGVRFYLSVKFDDAKVNVVKPQTVPLSGPVPTTPWVCKRCQARNVPESLRCKVCSLVRP